MSIISIGLPVYNATRTLKLAVASVLGQSFQDWELIICDDASTDDSFEIATSIRDARIRVVRNARNLGLSACLDRFVELAQAPLVARMVSDDLLHPDRLRRQVDVFEAHSDIEVVSTDAFVVDDHNRVLGGRRKGEIVPTAAGI
ncbi:MAG TPA: glycosyltransferase, partial [Bryobacteraceae bacterium]